MWVPWPCVLPVILQRTSHYCSFEGDAPSDERTVSPAERQTQRLTSLPEQTLLGNVKMDADGGGAAACFFHNRPFMGNNRCLLPKVCFQEQRVNVLQLDASAHAVNETQRTGKNRNQRILF